MSLTLLIAAVIVSLITENERNDSFNRACDEQAS